MRWMIVCGAMLALLSGCGRTGSATDAGGCEWARPIYVGRADVLTDETARAVLAHNEAWAAICRGGTGAP